MKMESILLDLSMARVIYKNKTVPDSLKDQLRNAFGEAHLSDNICDMIKTMEDIYRINGTTYEEVIPFKDPKNKDQTSTNADALIKQITKAYNQGIVLNWLDKQQPKYYLWFERTTGEWVLRDVCGDYCDAHLGSGHYFSADRLARDAYNKFKQIWDDYLPE